MDHTVIIKKYVNRHLYDTGKSVNVTLTQVADYIHEGQMVQIIDAKTKEDVTDFILTQKGTRWVKTQLCFRQA